MPKRTDEQAAHHALRAMLGKPVHYVNAQGECMPATITRFDFGSVVELAVLVPGPLDPDVIIKKANIPYRPAQDDADPTCAHTWHQTEEHR